MTVTDASTDDVNVGQFALRPAPISVASGVYDMDLYQDRVIVRHEDVTPMDIAGLVHFDNTVDTDIPFIAATGTPWTLDVLSGSGLMVWDAIRLCQTGKLICKAPALIQDGSPLLGTGAVYTASTYPLTIGGSFFARSGATYTPATSQVTFAATTSGQSIGAIGGSTITFNSLVFDGGGGEWNIQTPIVSQAGITVATGTVRGSISDNRKWFICW
ncbi:MAG: hypothetical protein R3B69_00375 [Candidatus Paceibacterota bacterium]